MNDPRRPFLDATRAAALDGPAELPSAVRHAVDEGRAPPELAPLLDKIRSAPWSVTDADWAPLRAAYGEDAQFEWVVAAVLGAAGHRFTRAMAALDAVAPAPGRSTPGAPK